MRDPQRSASLALVLGMAVLIVVTAYAFFYAENHDIAVAPDHSNTSSASGR